MSDTSNQLGTFNEDLAKGIRLQKEILAAIKKKYPLAFIKDGHFKDYDIEIPEIGQTIEVKDESDSIKNFFIETSWNGQPSGVVGTKATWFVIGFKDELWWWKTEALKAFCLKENRQKFSNKDAAGIVVEGYSIPRLALRMVDTFKLTQKITSSHDCYLEGCDNPALKDIGGGCFCSKEHHEEWANKNYPPKRSFSGFKFTPKPKVSTGAPGAPKDEDIIQAAREIFADDGVATGKPTLPQQSRLTESESGIGDTPQSAETNQGTPQN